MFKAIFVIRGYMSEISWIKIKTNIFDDEKIKLIEAMPEADTVLIIWFKLLVQAGKCNECGDISLTKTVPYSIEMLSTIFNRPLQTVKYGIKILLDLSLIEMSQSNVISISNWEKHQNIDGMDKIREQNRIRQQNYREQKKLKQGQKTNKSNVTVTPRNALDKDIELDKDKKDIKHKYGEYKHVLLTDKEYARLVEDFGEKNTKHLVKTLDEGIELKGYKYKNHNLAIRNWSKNEKNLLPRQQNTFNSDEYFKSKGIVC